MQFSYEDSDSAQIAVKSNQQKKIWLLQVQIHQGEFVQVFLIISMYFVKCAYCRSIFPRGYKIAQVKKVVYLYFFTPVTSGFFSAN